MSNNFGSGMSDYWNLNSLLGEEESIEIKFLKDTQYLGNLSKNPSSIAKVKYLPISLEDPLRLPKVDESKNGKLDQNGQVIDQEDPSLWCCKQNKPGAAWIMCERPLCKTKWYHFGCVGLSLIPLGTWYCPTCVQILNQYNYEKERNKKIRNVTLIKRNERTRTPIWLTSQLQRDGCIAFRIPYHFTRSFLKQLLKPFKQNKDNSKNKNNNSFNRNDQKNLNSDQIGNYPNNIKTNQGIKKNNTSNTIAKHKKNFLLKNNFNILLNNHSKYYYYSCSCLFHFHHEKTILIKLSKIFSNRLKIIEKGIGTYPLTSNQPQLNKNFNINLKTNNKTVSSQTKQNYTQVNQQQLIPKKQPNETINNSSKLSQNLLNFNTLSQNSRLNDQDLLILSKGKNNLNQIKTHPMQNNRIVPPRINQNTKQTYQQQQYFDHHDQNYTKNDLLNSTNNNLFNNNTDNKSHSTLQQNNINMYSKPQKKFLNNSLLQSKIQKVNLNLKLQTNYSEKELKFHQQLSKLEFLIYKMEKNNQEKLKIWFNNKIKKD
ncbi:protein yng1 [Anaeramoeba flamelloides]|uniref:Protein yng1 n=1 Tax=Anaeramoeba flamelloides TaxID=1746091 RepID=A0ABQ8XPX9_9EUKA|nr:protein yng1 [Anaeramoeba flamelloides]